MKNVRLIAVSVEAVLTLATRAAIYKGLVGTAHAHKREHVRLAGKPMCDTQINNSQ